MAEEKHQRSAADVPAGTPDETMAPRRRLSGLRRWSKHLLALLTAIFAGLFVTIFSVDLGPLVLERAEREGS